MIRQGGFTLTDLMITMTIAAIRIGLGSSALSDLVENTRLMSNDYITRNRKGGLVEGDSERTCTGKPANCTDDKHRDERREINLQVSGNVRTEKCSTC